jgi:hypothetical protein
MISLLSTLVFAKSFKPPFFFEPVFAAGPPFAAAAGAAPEDFPEAVTLVANNPFLRSAAEASPGEPASIEPRVS